MNRILVVVDMQNDFIDGSLGTPEAKAIVPKVAEKIVNWDGDVFVTQDTHAENYLDTTEGKALPVKHCIYNTDGWKIHDDIRKAFCDMENGYLEDYIKKPTFGSYSLVDNIKTYYIDEGEPVDEIVLVGLCTGICVAANATLLKAAFYDKIKITVDASCCACVTPESHKIALEAMKLQQINIINED